MNDIPKQEVQTKKEVKKPFTFEIPQCCREGWGWPRCKHVAPNVKERKKNVGL